MKTKLIVGAMLIALLSLIVVSGFTPVFASEKVIHWKMQTVDDPGLMEYKLISHRFADRVRELSRGRLDIKVYPPDGMVSSFEVWDAVRKGLIQISQHYLVYWSGKEPALKSNQEWPVLVDPLQGLIWIYQGGGREVLNELLDKHGIVYLGATPMEGEQIWSKKPIRGLADLKGLKMRASGLAADSLTQYGVSVVTVPGGEIYQALERGVIDACEFTFPTVNYGYGFHEVTDYVTQTLWGGGFYDWIVNKKAYNALPDELKTVVDVAIKEVTLDYWLKVRLETQKVMAKLKEDGTVFTQWSPEDIAAYEKTRLEVMKKYAENSEGFNKKLQSMMTTINALK